MAGNLMPIERVEVVGVHPRHKVLDYVLIHFGAEGPQRLKQVVS